MLGLYRVSSIDVQMIILSSIRKPDLFDIDCSIDHVRFKYFSKVKSIAMMNQRRQKNTFFLNTSVIKKKREKERFGVSF